MKLSKTLLTEHINQSKNDKSNKYGDLFIVSTPIGNKDDITLRALKVLGQVDLIAAEDTRHTKNLLNFYQIKTKLISFYEHNEQVRAIKLIEDLKNKISIALVSDAGTPTISDPGYRLVTEAVKNDINVIPIPGVSAPITAISASGFPTDSFLFIGFLPKKKNMRMEKLKFLADFPFTMIFYESSKRIKSLVNEIISTFGDRDCLLCREMTKLYEEFIRGTLSELLSILENRLSLKGEITFIVQGKSKSDTKVCFEVVKNEIEKALKHKVQNKDISVMEIAKELAKKYNYPKRLVYNEILKFKKNEII